MLDISLSSTVLGHPDLSRGVIPNRKMVGEILYGKIRQLAVEVTVSPDAMSPPRWPRSRRRSRPTRRC